jgi:hypothetical protein
MLKLYDVARSMPRRSGRYSGHMHALPAHAASTWNHSPCCAAAGPPDDPPSN